MDPQTEMLLQKVMGGPAAAGVPPGQMPMDSRMGANLPMQQANYVDQVQGPSQQAPMPPGGDADAIVAQLMQMIMNAPGMDVTPKSRANGQPNKRQAKSVTSNPAKKGEKDNKLVDMEE